MAKHTLKGMKGLMNIQKINNQAEIGKKLNNLLYNHFAAKKSHTNIFPTPTSTPTSLLNLLNNYEPEIGESTKQLSKVNPKFEVAYKKCAIIS